VKQTVVYCWLKDGVQKECTTMEEQTATFDLQVPEDVDQLMFETTKDWSKNKDSRFVVTVTY